MEAARNRQRSGGADFSMDSQYRLSRPSGSQSSQQGRNAFGGKIMGSSFSQTPKKLKKPPPAAASSDHDYVSSDDQLDSLSEYHGSPKRKKRKENESYVDENGKHHDYHPDYPPDRTNAYKNLKFKKNKQTTGPERAAPETIEVVSDGNSNNRKDKGDRLVKKTKPAAFSSSQDKKAARGRPLRDQNTPALEEMSSSPPRPPPPRPRPRPTGPTKSSLAKLTDPAPRRTSRNGKPTDVARTERDPSVEIVDSHQAAPRTPLAQPFPMIHSPVESPPPTSVPASSLNLKPKPFPGLELTPRTSESRRPSKTTETRAPKPFPLAASSTSTVKKGKGKHRRVITSDPESDPDVSPQAKAAPFPLSETFFDDPGGAKSSRDAGPSRPRRKARKFYAESESDDDEDVQGKVAPFPLGTQFFKDVGSPSAAKPHKKRLSDGLDCEDPSPRKRSKGNDSLFDDEPFDEGSFFISADTDPKTLCPYCDDPLPTSPSPILTMMLEDMFKKSSRDPRPANPLGRKAPFATFIDLCHRHQFESKILPEAEKKGWPKAIDWDSLSARIEQMQSELQKLIDDTSEKGPRSRSAFWQDIMKSIKAKGIRVATGVQDQFENFEKTQPGYYGELGSVIIHQTLYDLFPPASIDTEAIAPLGAEEFLQRVLIPEVALRLIMEDRHLKGSSGRQTALQVLRESSSYGVAMFPADGTEPTGEGRTRRSKNNPDGLTAGETIIMERARRRRKEIEEEDAREEAAAEAERIRMMQVDAQPKARPRPRPRHVSKGSSKSSMMDVSKTDDEDLIAAPQHPDTDPIEPNDYGADQSESDGGSEIVVFTQLQPSRRFRSPVVVTEDEKPRRSTRSRAGSVKPSRRRNGSSPTRGGWSTNGDSESKGKKAANLARNRRRRQENRREESDANDLDSGVNSIVEVDTENDAPVSNTKTPRPRRKNHPSKQLEEESTPRPSRPIAPSSSQAELPPLLKARAFAEARKAAAAVKGPKTTDNDQEKRSSRSVPINSPKAQGGKGLWVHSMRAGYGKDENSSDEDSSEEEEDPPPRKPKDKSHSWLLSESSSNHSTPRKSKSRTR